MVLNHIHFQVRDIEAAIDWLDTIWQIRPGFRNERMATFSFTSVILIFDVATDDTPATVGFESDDCDRDFQHLAERGAIVLEPPTNKDWGVRSAYFKGPGALKFEIEGPIVNR